jgi:Arc/MetJ family transcription regulator
LCIEKFIEMRTNIDIDDKLLKEAMKETKISVKKDLVNTALKEMLHKRRVEKFKQLQGKVIWVGDLNKMRTYDKWEDR